MKKVFLTEEQFKTYIRSAIAESIVSEKNATKLGKDKLDAITAHLAKRAQAGDESLLQKAKENGINIDSLKGNIGRTEYESKFNAQVNALLDQRNAEINRWVITYLPTLRKLYFRKNNKGEIESSVTIDNTVMDSLPNDERKNVLLLKDFLDKEGLTFLYRKATKPVTVAKRYGLDLQKGDVNCNTPVDKLNLDFSNISDSEIDEYYDGTRIKWINDRLRKLGFDADGEKKVEKGSDSYEAAKKISLIGKRKMVAERYVQRTYGMEFYFGKFKNLFSYGNQKISNDTLIINFSAAMRCPAWNECLLKDACYARTTERNYDNTLNRNLRTNLIWEQTQEDPELMQLMLELIRTYLFDYSKITALAQKVERRKVPQEELCKLSLSEIQSKYGEEAIKILRDNSRAKIIRLNEDGDFIGQWLVDAWDAWAQDFKLAGITVTAYTCRALNYEKVSAMIINLSQEGLLKGKNAPAVAHFFYAVSPDEYNTLAETYGGSRGFDLEVQSNGKIIPVYRKLVEDGTLKGYYYKCPCGRGKVEYVAIDKSELPQKAKISQVSRLQLVNARDDDPKYVECDGNLYRMQKVVNRGNSVDCYMCRVCYGRDSEEKILTEDGVPPQKGLPVYILVSTHGQNEEEFDSDKASAVRSMAGKKAKDWITLQSLSESVEGFKEENDPSAIKQVVKNTIESVVNMMRGKNRTISEIRNTFNRKLNDITNH